jgi:selenoprotein W-related protein
VRLADDLLKIFESEIESITLVPSSGGRYEISVNGQLIFSKLQTGRHAEPDEVVRLFKKISKKKM